MVSRNLTYRSTIGAKLCRMRHKTEEAIEIIEDALVKAPSFREADSLLVFELSWLHLSSSSYVKAADSFCRMCELNSWSHSTYLAIAAGKWHATRPPSTSYSNSNAQAA